MTEQYYGSKYSLSAHVTSCCFGTITTSLYAGDVASGGTFSGTMAVLPLFFGAGLGIGGFGLANDCIALSSNNKTEEEVTTATQSTPIVNRMG